MEIASSSTLGLVRIDISGTFTPQQARELMAQIGAEVETLAPSPDQPGPGTKIHCAERFAWYCDWGGLFGENFLLAMRDPRYGWLGCMLPKAEVTKLSIDAALYLAGKPPRSASAMPINRDNESPPRAQ